MKTISQAAADFGLSRSTLLHYDRIGLCRPTYRTAAGYRLYSDEELEVLRLICQYRESGMNLKGIAQILEDPEPSRIVAALNDQLKVLNREVSSRRKQQAVILNLLKSYKSDGSPHVMNKAAWVSLLKSCGMDEDDMRLWHVMFERQSPEAHQDFLESLAIPPAEIKRIREMSRTSS